MLNGSVWWTDSATSTQDVPICILSEKHNKIKNGIFVGVFSYEAMLKKQVKIFDFQGVINYQIRKIIGHELKMSLGWKRASHRILTVHIPFYT